MANLTTVTSVANYFKLLVDENDSTFLSNDMLGNFLSAGYDEFRAQIIDQDPECFIVSASYALSNTQQIDLSNAAPLGPSILGPTITSGSLRMERIERLYKLKDDGFPGHILNPVYTLEELKSEQISNSNTNYMLTNNLLRFSNKISGTHIMEYIPQQNVDWTKTAPGDTEWIDSYVSWHDLIALFAAKIYAVPDNAVSAALERLLQSRLTQYRDFVSKSRIENASTYVKRKSGGHRRWYNT
jgi:hypothetical protein